MIDAGSTHPLSEFQQNPADHIRRLKQTGRPEVLTVDGQAELVVQDAAAYGRLLDELDRAQAVAGIRRGLDTMRQGAGRPMREALEALADEHGIDLSPPPPPPPPPNQRSR